MSVRTFVRVQNFFRDQLSQQIPCDHRHSLAFKQPSSGAIPVTMSNYQCFLKSRFPQMLEKFTRTLWCDSSLTYSHTITPFDAPGKQAFENNVGKGEIARNKQFLLFPQCFLSIWITFFHFCQI